jgi:hypothetical protein
MAYSTGSATSQNDLVQQLASWLVTQGWTLDTSAAEGSGWRCHLHKGGHYVHFRVQQTGDPFDGHYLLGNTQPYLAVYLSTAYAGSGSPWFASTTGAPLGTDNKVLGSCIVVNPGANAAFHFFNDGNDNYTIVVERDAGLCQILGFGMNLIKHGGNWTGGAFIFGQFGGGESSDYALDHQTWCPFCYGADEVGLGNGGFVRADVDSFIGKWIGIGPGVEARTGYTGKVGFSTTNGKTTLPGTLVHTMEIAGRTVSSVNTQAVLLPLRIYAQRDEGGPALIGSVPSIWEAEAVYSGYLFGAEIQIGADTYKLFPHVAIKKVA